MHDQVLSQLVKKFQGQIDRVLDVQLRQEQENDTF